MTVPIRIPELLAPAGSLDAVRAAVANGADAVYLGAERFNARDEGAQLSLDDLERACDLAHERGVRIYLTLNTLVKPGELADALSLLGDAIERGIDAAIVQDLGLVRLIRAVYPAFEIHGSTQMTVHDASGALVMRELGIDRVVLARENTLEDIRAIHEAVPGLGLEHFVHGALCISYSGQCFMSGMISERSANRGSCAQSCRKDYVLTDSTTREELDRGYLISAKDLAAHDHLAELADAGVSCLKVEGRKKKPEYVATVTRSYREFLERVSHGDRTPPSSEEIQPLVQIFSRGNTAGMLEGRVGRDYITRAHPDNRGVELGLVVAERPGEIEVELREALVDGDGVGFEPPVGTTARQSIGFTIAGVRTLDAHDARVRQTLPSRVRVPVGWRVVRSSEAALLERARASYAALPDAARRRRVALTIRVFGSAGAPLKLIATADGEQVVVRGEVPLVPAAKRPLDVAQLREQLGRLGQTPFVLGEVDAAGLGAALFIPVSDINHIRQSAVEELMLRRDWAREARLADRTTRIETAISVSSSREASRAAADSARDDALPFALAAHVYTESGAREAAAAGATEIVFDPFLRHPMPPAARVRALAMELAVGGVALRVRTPSIVRPGERRTLAKWLALDLPLLSGHLGLVAELAQAARDVVADYATNCFNQHTAAELFRLGASRIVLSVELTVEEMAAVSAPWGGAGFDVVAYGRPEGMTIEHCVLSAAFDREPTTCRDLCVRKHPVVELTDPAGYTFGVATDSACRNRLLHSRPIEASEFLPRLWRDGLRGYHMLFNVPGDPVRDLVRAYRDTLDALASGGHVGHGRVRDLMHGAFTRGHFARAV